MDDIDTPEKLADLLKSSGISDGAIEVLKEEEISGEEFLVLSLEDLRGAMNLKMGQIKKLLKLQAQYRPQAPTGFSSIPGQDKRPPSQQLATPVQQTPLQQQLCAWQQPLTHAIIIPITEISLAKEILRFHQQTSPQQQTAFQQQTTPQQQLLHAQQTPQTQAAPVIHLTEMSFAKEILGLCTEIQSEPGPPQVFKLPVVPKAVAGEKDVIMYEVGKKDTAHWQHRQRVVMVVGATGAGKTTLINGMANYLFSVEWKDNFRFKLVTDDEEGGKDQASSKTKHITAYYFPWQTGSKVPYGLTIIDTPGFGDTGGLKEDKRTFHQIRQLFMNPAGIHQLDAIGFVTQSSLGRLTPTQQYIFDSILSIFGKDIGDNIFLMTTFADAHRPPVLDAVNKAGIKYQASFRFNNSALFVDNEQETENGNFDEMFWKMGMKSFEKFFTHIGKIETKSLLQTREVLIEREQLQILVQGLQPQIQLGLAKIDEFRQEERVVKEHEAEISKSKDFKYEVTIKKQRVIDLSGAGVFTTNCLQCNFTCHDSCRYSKDEDKIKCRAMNNGYCTVCTKKCKWDQHRNTPYRYEWYDVVETRTSEDLQRRYSIATSGKSKVESLMASLESDLKMMRQVVLQMVHQTKKCLQRLSEIALKPNPLTEVEYIDTLIQSEEDQGRRGFRERVKALKELRREAKLLSGMSELQIGEYMKADHKTFFEQFQPQPAQPPQQKPGLVQRAINYLGVGK
jgi:energy-coupling factor transporter ATP-binding protein EcfA2